uniref:NADH dehydrogenase subunit 4 n=1 Tax=Ayyaria chaetophora TaxID=1291247 RepID=UPI0030E38439
MLTFFFFFFVLFFLLFSFSFFFFSFFIILFYPFLFFFEFSQFSMSKNMFFLLDSFSFHMVVLSFWVIMLSVLSSFSAFFSFYSPFLNLSFFILLVFLSFFFFSCNYLMFFFFFECSLFPILFIIIGWGKKVERISSGLYMFFYTFFSSLPLLYSILFLNGFSNCFSFFFQESFEGMEMIYIFCFLSFLVKMPMFFFHSWLPKAHVEAPVSGSMILAGVLLKMGGYGLYRFFFIYKYTFMIKFWIFISVWGGVLSGLMCIRQTDLKSLIAYSSVSHMSLVVIGFLIMNCMTVMAGLMLMIAHGFCSSGLFFLCNLFYERLGSRNVFLSKGLGSYFPNFTMWWFFFCSFNMACPPSLNLLSEIFYFIGSISWSSFILYLNMILSFFSGLYNMFLFSFCFHGVSSASVEIFYPCNLREYYIVFFHFFPILFFFLGLRFIC